MTIKELAYRDWVPTHCENRVQQWVNQTAASSTSDIQSLIKSLTKQNKFIHEQQCFNLNPATNVMNPVAEQMLASGLGTRPSLGYPGDKYEMGLESIEEIEVITAQLAAQVFDADYAEIRVPSGAIANLYSFMACCEPGDSIIVPPASIGGHVTHHDPGCAGLYKLDIHPAPVNADGYTLDIGGLAELAAKTRPKMITIGGSLNLFPHPVSQVTDIAREVGAKLLFDAAHQCGMIAGRVWPNPILLGADVMTMSTYKSLGGPPSGLIVTNNAEIAEKLDTIAFPGMTANFDAAKSAALAITLLDWIDQGNEYAQVMVDTAKGLAEELDKLGIPIFANEQGFTQSHQFAVVAAPYGGGQTASKKLRKAGFLACGIGLPVDAVKGDMNGLRIGTPELVRWGMTVADMPKLAGLISQALNSDEPDALADEVALYRQSFDQIHFVRN